MYSDKDNMVLPYWVAPFGDLRVKAFFQLTEAYRRLRVLHRLLMPRHPPAALIYLTSIINVVLHDYFVQNQLYYTGSIDNK
jgi:hypothetical protein